MSEFRGFRCDGCGAIVSIEDRVKEVVRFVDPDGDEGSYYRDLCVTECAPKRHGEVEEGYHRTPTRAKRKHHAGANQVVARAS